MKTRTKTIVVYNLEVNEESLVLANTIAWIRAFSELFAEVKVYSTHVGKFELPNNVTVIEIGGGTCVKRIIAIKRLLESVLFIKSRKRDTVVFHHMSSITAGTIGCLIALLDVPQGLWYSHSYPDKYLRASKYWIDYFFSSSEKSFPIESSKVFFTGHGLQTEIFNQYDVRIVRSGVVSVGRGTKIKNLESGLTAIAQSKIRDKTLHLYGETDQDSSYLKELQLIAKKLEINLNFHGPIPYGRLPTELQKYSFVFSGTPMSTDKALLEGALSGCFPITMNSDSEGLTGVFQIWEKLSTGSQLQLSQKLDLLDQLSVQSQDEYRRIISSHTTSTSDVFVTVRKIAQQLTTGNIQRI